MILPEMEKLKYDRTLVMGTIAAFRKRLTWKGVVDALSGTLRTTCMIFAIIIGAKILNYFLAVTGVPMAIADVVTGLELLPLGIMAIILVVYIISTFSTPRPVPGLPKTA